MKAILLSIKPIYVQRIMDGSKKYEYRKRLAKKDVDVIYIYATSSIKKVVAKARISSRLEGSPKELWNKTKEHAGIEEKAYMGYFKSSKIAYAYGLKDIEVFKEPKDLKDYGVGVAPQSFAYLDV